MMAVVPIGLPMLAGPGTISLVIAESPADLPGRLLLSGLIVALALVVFLVLIASVATQMLVSGLRESFPVLAG